MDHSIVYLAGVAVMSLRMIFNLIRILQMKRSGETHRIGFHSIIVNTCVNEPFTFFNWIFFPDIKLTYDNDILCHELLHVRKRHSIDILITEMITVFLWFQPLIYLYRHAISLNHEYQADELAASHAVNTVTYLQKLTSAHSVGQWNLTSSFSFLFIKKRIVMINKKKSSRSIIIKASLALLLSICIASFSAFKPVSSSEKSIKTYTVVIDAGHGGRDTGYAANGLFEKDIVLAISQKIKGHLESKSNIRVLVTREDDIQIDEEQRIVLSENADLFVSLHTNTAEVEVIDRPMVVYQDRGEFSSLSKRAANLIASELQTCDRECIVAYSSPVIHEEAKCPVIELTLGYLNQDWFAENLSTELGQLFYAEKIARGIEMAAQ